MICPFCGTDNTMCVDSRQKEKYRARRYECMNCNERFSTKEVATSVLKVNKVYIVNDNWEIVPI